jgi:hypothetical protein
MDNTHHVHHDVTHQRVLGWIAGVLHHPAGRLATRTQYEVSDAGTLIITWRDGPPAHVIVAELQRAAEALNDPDMQVRQLPPRDSTSSDGCLDPTAGHLAGDLAVGGVRVLLRAIDPVSRPERSRRGIGAWPGHPWPGTLSSEGYACDTILWDQPDIKDQAGQRERTVAVVVRTPIDVNDRTDWSENSYVVATTEPVLGSTASPSRITAWQNTLARADVALHLAPDDQLVPDAHTWLDTHLELAPVVAVIDPRRCYAYLRSSGLRVLAELATTGPNLSVVSLVPSVLLHLQGQDAALPGQLTVRRFGGARNDQHYRFRVQAGYWDYRRPSP